MFRKSKKKYWWVLKKVAYFILLPNKTNLVYKKVLPAVAYKIQVWNRLKIKFMKLVIQTGELWKSKSDRQGENILKKTTFESRLQLLRN